MVRQKKGETPETASLEVWVVHALRQRRRCQLQIFTTRKYRWKAKHARKGLWYRSAQADVSESQEMIDRKFMCLETSFEAFWFPSRLAGKPLSRVSGD